MSNVSSSNSQKANLPKLQFNKNSKLWNEIFFSDAFEFLPNNTLSRSELTEYGTTKNIHYGDILIKYDDTLNGESEEIPYIKKNISYREFYLNDGDIVIADTAEDETVGKAIELYNITTNIVSGLHTIPCRPKVKFYSGYLGYYLNSFAYRKQLLPLMQGIKVLSLSKTNISKTLLRYPDILEQEKIANMFNLINKKISLQKRQIKLLKSYKRGVISYLNSHTSNSFEISIGSIFKITRGNVLSTREISPIKTSEYCYPVYSSQTKNEGLLGYYDKFLYENAITWTTDGANAGYTKYRQGKFYCTNVCGVLINDKGYSNAYVAEMINLISKKYVSYVGNPKLMNNVMSEIKLIVPKVQEQQKYSHILSFIDKRINMSTNILNNLNLIKDSLLQKMFI